MYTIPSRKRNLEYYDSIYSPPSTTVFQTDPNVLVSSWPPAINTGPSYSTLPSLSLVHPDVAGPIHDPMAPFNIQPSIPHFNEISTGSTIPPFGPSVPSTPMDYSPQVDPLFTNQRFRDLENYMHFHPRPYIPSRAVKYLGRGGYTHSASCPVFEPIGSSGSPVSGVVAVKMIKRKFGNYTSFKVFLRPSYPDWPQGHVLGLVINPLNKTVIVLDVGNTNLADWYTGTRHVVHKGPTGVLHPSFVFYNALFLFLNDYRIVFDPVDEGKYTECAKYISDVTRKR